MLTVDLSLVGKEERTGEERRVDCMYVCTVEDFDSGGEGGKERKGRKERRKEVRKEG